MKKIKTIVVSIAILILSWCLPKSSNIVDFNKSLETLNIQSNNLFSNYIPFFDTTGIVYQDILFNLSSSQGQAPINLSIKALFSLDWFEQNYSNQTHYNVNMFDKTTRQKIISSWNFVYSNISYVPYFKLNEFYIDMWTWSIESNFLQILMSWILNKRLMIDIQNNKNFIQEYVDINYLLKDISSLNNCQIFYKIRNTIYKWNRAYKIGLNTENIKNCLHKPFIDYTGIVFEWFITPLNNDNILLEVKKFQLPSNKNLFISWEFDKKHLKVTIHNSLTKFTSTIDIKYNTKHDSIIAKSNNYIYNINVNKFKERIKFDWDLTFITNNINQSEVKFDIKWNLALQNTWYLDIKAPQNYMIMSQLLWDKFSLRNILWQ